MISDYLWAARRYPAMTALATVLALLGLTTNLFLLVMRFV